MVSQQSVERFKREARVVAEMGHRSIVSVYDSGEDQGSLFFVMPYVEGANLRAVLRTESVTLGQIIEIGSQIAIRLIALNPYPSMNEAIHQELMQKFYKASEKWKVVLKEYASANRNNHIY